MRDVLIRFRDPLLTSPTLSHGATRHLKSTFYCTAYGLESLRREVLTDHVTRGKNYSDQS